MTRRPILVLALLAAQSAAIAQPGFPPDNPDSWRVAATAKILCSALFVSGRDESEAVEHVAPYFISGKLDSITAVDVDRQRELVRLTLANRITREAKLYGDQGCIIHQPGKDTVYFRPVRVTTKLPPAATLAWPMGDALPTTPLPSDVDTVKLRQAVDAAFANPAGLTAAFVVVHRGRIIAERYANGANREMQLESWSMGKSIVGTLIGVLVQQGALRLEDPAPVAEWHKTPNDPRARIRVMDLMRMSSGLRFSRGAPEDLPGFHDHDLPYAGAIDGFQFAVTRPLQFEPNTVGRYRNVDPLTLGLIIRDAVRKRGDEYLTWPQRALFDRIGIRRQVVETDPYGNFLMNGYDYGTARNWARLGMLYLNDGVWNGQRILPGGFVKFVSTPAPAWHDSSYGGMVWVNARGTWPLPRDAFAFRGAGLQDTYVVPSRQLVVVRMGHMPGAREAAVDLDRSLALLMEAIPPKQGTPDATSRARALQALTAQPIIDGHNDLPWRIREDSAHPMDVEGYDLRKPTPGHTDIARLKQGHVGAQFWSIYIPGERSDAAYKPKGAVASTPGYARVQLEQFDIARRAIAKYPDLEWTLTSAAIPAAIRRGHIGSLLGLEGGHAIENSLALLRVYYDLGARYMTLTHNVTLDWADAALDTARHGGLTPFGREVVREMNRLGMLVDLSHVSPGVMSNALDVSAAPVIFSHSGSRALVDHPRNVPDSILARVPKNGGVVMVPFVTAFVSRVVKEDDDSVAAHARTARQNHPNDSTAARAEFDAWRASHARPKATIADVADVIDHVKQIAGVDHVGIGSDFDGISETVVGLEDVSKFPALFTELARRGWSESDLRKLAGGNILRVLRDAERVSTRLKRERQPSIATIEQLDGAAARATP